MQGGGIFRSDTGHAIGSFAFPLGIFFAFLAKLQAAMYAVKQTADRGWWKLWIECDSTYVVHMISYRSHDVHWSIRLDWMRCLKTMHRMEIRVFHIFREGNKIADALANYGRTATSCDCCEFPAIFNFGDSNSDTGSIETAFGRLNPPFGITYFQKPAGRFCDGRLIVDFIAEKLNIPHVNAYLNWMGKNFTNGANFANGGATIDLHSSIVAYDDESRFANGGATVNVYATIIPYGEWSPLNLQIQYLQFLKFKLNSQLLRKQVFAELMPVEEYFSKALYIFDIGQNDIGVGLLIGKSIQEVNASIPDIINKFSAIVENVYNSGGRSFWIHNSGPLGCLPFYILINPKYNLPSEKDEAGCVKIYNQVIENFNFKLNESIVQLRTKYPSATFVYVDIYSVKYSLFTSPQQHGFEQPLVTCCGHGGTYNYRNEAPCGSKIQVNGEEILVDSCNDPSIRVVWDGGHYTEAANKFVFNQISSGAFSHPPIPLEMSCHNVDCSFDERFDGEIGDPTQVSQPFEQCNVAF